MKWLVLIVMLVVGCGSSKAEKEKAEQEAKAKAEAEKVEKEKAEKEKEGGGLLGGLAGRAKEMGDEVAAKAKDMGGEVAGKVKDMGSDVVAKAKEVAAKAGDISTDAFASGQALKDDLAGKLKFANSHFDVALDSMPESEADYKARLAGMKQIKVGDYSVGVAQDAKHPLGTVYKWQFRITWRVPTGQAVRISVFTDEALEDLATAANLLTIVQASEKLLKLK
jgi:hypothetical protein